MAKIEFKKTGLEGLNKVSVQCGWFNTGEHPGYAGKKPSGATVAAIAMFNANRKGRDYISLFKQMLFKSATFKNLLKSDIRTAMQHGKFDAKMIGDEMKLVMIAAIKEGDWTPNSPAWLAFKVKHGLSLSPLIASQVMLNELQSRVKSS